MCDMVNRNCFIGMSAAEQKEHFDEHGFLLLPAVLDADSVATVLAEMAQVTASRDSAGDWRGAFDYQGLDYGTQYDAAYGSWPPASVEQLICHPTILAVSQPVPTDANASATPCLLSPCGTYSCSNVGETGVDIAFAGHTKPLRQCQIFQRGFCAFIAPRRPTSIASRLRSTRPGWERLPELL